MLSLGCTVEPLNAKWGRRLPLGKGYWGAKIADVFMAGQSSLSLGTAFLLTGHDATHEKVVRISPAVPGKRFGLDVVSNLQIEVIF